MRDSTGGSNGAATQEAEPGAVSLAGGTAVVASEAGVGDGGDVGNDVGVGLGDGVGNSTPHPTTSPNNRMVSKSAGLRIVASFDLKIGGILPQRAALNNPCGFVASRSEYDQCP